MARCYRRLAIAPLSPQSGYRHHNKEPAMSSVSEIPAASSDQALAHFSASLTYETDCADVHAALSSGTAPDFVLLDVRGPALFARGHVPGAVNLPHGKIVESKLADYPPRTSSSTKSGAVPLLSAACTSAQSVS
jgi:rhodanese-related sulfurtransferase